MILAASRMLPYLEFAIRIESLLHSGVKNFTLQNHLDL